jgi:SH3 domain-containing YSC84-like protein 1
MTARSGAIALLALTLAVSAPGAAEAEAEAEVVETLVEEAALTLERFHAGEVWSLLHEELRIGYGVVIIPGLVRAGLIVGGESGKGVLLVRDTRSGDWSHPAFVEVASGSVGLQAGMQLAEVVLIIRTEGGLERLIDDSIVLGVDAGVAFAGAGAGIEGATTTNLDADIVALAIPRGAFAGLVLKGALISLDDDGNEAYYGRPVTFEEIVAGEVDNPQADALRLALAEAPVEADSVPGLGD